MFNRIIKYEGRYHTMFINEFQEKIWKDKYQYKDETYEQFCNRIANTVFIGEANKAARLKESIMDFRTLFGGRINSNIGVDEGGLTLFNCYIAATVKQADSLEGILDALKNYALTLKSEGGIGFCANFLRPAKTLIRKIGVSSPGSIKFLEVFDKVSECITSGSVATDDSYQGKPTKKSIRKGATMVTMSVNHPDIEDFITAKSVPNRLTKMNMSVLVTDAFMYCVQNKLSWDLWFPDINFEKYDEEWDSDFEKWAEKGYPTVVYRTIDAVQLWELLLRNSFMRNEPGVLFIDNIRRMDNISYLPGCSMLACNPCAEISSNTGVILFQEKLIELGDVCNLGSLNVTRYYDMKTKLFNTEQFLLDIDLMVEALDNIIDISNYPLPMYEDAAKLKRKIGLGVCGIGSLLMMMGIRYGSDDSILILKDLLSKFMNRAYQASALLAKERGPFALYDDKVLECGYVKNSGVLTDETINMIRMYGLRHCALSAIAPNGSLSILAGNVSGGLEPVFSPEFNRWNRVEGKTVDFIYPLIHKGEWYETDYFKEEMAFGEAVLYSTDGNYRIDKNQGLCKKHTIRDYGYNLAKEYGLTEFTSATELSVIEHLKVLEVFASHIDLSCSKTINLPKDISFEEFSSLYGDIYKYGIKGCTTYREGTSIAVLETKKEVKEQVVKEQQNEFLDAFKNHYNGEIIQDIIKLPEEYPSKGYILRAEKKKFYIHVAFKDIAMTKPFAIFVNTNDQSPTLITNNAIDKLKELAIDKGLGNGKLADVEEKFSKQKNSVKIARMLGYLLRHNVQIIDIVHALDRVEDAHIGTFVFRIKKFLMTFITEPIAYEGMSCPSCGGHDLILQEGCVQCRSCFYSACG